MTTFIHTRAELAPHLYVVLDGNSKITAGNGTYEAPTPNALSLPAASVSAPGYCPGSTPTCRASCYVRGLAKHAPDVYKAYAANAVALTRILALPAQRRANTAEALGAWIAEHAAGGFRWHVSGDVWGDDHARWIVAVCAASPTVAHWIYTRTLGTVRILVTAPNLAVNVSADRDNADGAIRLARALGARVAYMATKYETVASEIWPLAAGVPIDQLRDGDVVFPDYPLRGRELADPTSHAYWQNAPHRLRVMTCPADFFGQSEAHRCGPCAKCLTPQMASSVSRDTR